MPVETLDTKNQPNNHFVFKKGNYVSFNSSNPFAYNPFACKRRKSHLSRKRNNRRGERR